jgi:hypothetical protein
VPTLRFRRFDEIPPEDQEYVAFLRGRMRGREHIEGIFGAQAHWPAYMAANHKQALASYQSRARFHNLPRRLCTSRSQWRTAVTFD